MITTRSYFTGNLQIANAEDTAPNSNLLGNASMLQDFINIYERELLILLFGHQMYADFKAQFDINLTTGEWTIKAGADQKWKDLLNGHSYTHGGVEKNWNGLIQNIGGTKISLIANYVYCKFINATEIEHAGVGFTVAKSKNAIRVSGRSKYVTAWNEMVEKLNGKTYSNYENYYSDWYWDNSNVPLNAYLRDNSELFENWKTEKYFEYTNRFGI